MLKACHCTAISILYLKMRIWEEKIKFQKVLFLVVADSCPNMELWEMKQMSDCPVRHNFYANTSGLSFLSYR